MLIKFNPDVIVNDDVDAVGAGVGEDEDEDEDDDVASDGVDGVAEVHVNDDDDVTSDDDETGDDDETEDDVADFDFLFGMASAFNLGFLLRFKSSAFKSRS